MIIIANDSKDKTYKAFYASNPESSFESKEGLTHRFRGGHRFISQDAYNKDGTIDRDKASIVLEKGN